MGVHQTFGESQTHQIPIFASISPLDFSEDFFTQKAMKWCCVFSSFSNGLITSCENFSPFMVRWHFRALLPTLKNLFVLKKGQKWFEFEIPSNSHFESLLEYFVQKLFPFYLKLPVKRLDDLIVDGNW